jgi:hypothetical protein
MTTIACNRECMAADTRVSIDGAAFYNSPKLFRVGDSIFGTAGDGMMCLVMIEWLKTKRVRKELYENWTEHTERSACWILELSPEGIFVWDGWGMREPLLNQRYAIGSGQVAALKGMDMGQSPEDAVKQAPDYDQYSGAPIQVEYLLPPELKRKRKRG